MTTPMTLAAVLDPQLARRKRNPVGGLIQEKSRSERTLKTGDRYLEEGQCVSKRIIPPGTCEHKRARRA